MVKRFTTMTPYHFLIIYFSLYFSHSMYIAEVKWSENHSVVSDSLWPHGQYSLWNSPLQNTGVGSLSLLQGIFPTQGSIPGPLHCRWICYQLSHQGSPSYTWHSIYIFIYHHLFPPKYNSMWAEIPFSLLYPKHQEWCKIYIKCSKKY